MAALIAVDWGSSSFRAALMDASGSVLAQLATDQGATKLTRDQFEGYLLQQINPWLQAHPSLPTLMCGMVGSTLGWQEVPYLTAPLELSALGQHLVPVRDTPLNVSIVPGISGQSIWGEPDMMRGEETQIMGWLSRQSARPEQAILCLPGTHTKWAFMQGSRLKHFSTAFSGELFALLKSASVLVRGEQDFTHEAFMQGVVRSATGDALNHILFSARSRVLAGQLAAEHAGAYLSGMIVGAEISAYREHIPQGAMVEIIGSGEVASAYQAALEFHNIDSRVNAGSALSFAGLYWLAEQLNK